MTEHRRRLVADGPILVFGGPYSNLEATRAVLAEARRLAIPQERVICTGDVVAYCGSAAETTRLVFESGVNVVKGNCDEQLGEDADDCGCGFPDGSACDRLSTAWYAYARGQVDEGDRRWFASLPERIDLEIGGARLAVVHGSVSRINAFIFATSDIGEKRAELALSGSDGVIGGHCGLAFSQVIDGRLWHNAGVVGMPANDGTRRVWYSVISPLAGGGVRIEHRPLEYDFRSAMARMVEAGLPADYRVALETGIWPSHDVLPEYERAVTGRAIEGADTIIWRPGAASSAGPIAGHPATAIDAEALWPAASRASAPNHGTDLREANADALA